MYRPSASHLLRTGKLVVLVVVLIDGLTLRCVCPVRGVWSGGFAEGVQTADAVRQSRAQAPASRLAPKQPHPAARGLSGWHG